MDEVIEEKTGITTMTAEDPMTAKRLVLVSL